MIFLNVVSILFLQIIIVDQATRDVSARIKYNVNTDYQN